ncbi:hypothetical protein [Microbacterium sp. SLBN-111]|uniref:hypothetical protein n=1 Tax=Microbacterium sp. SLBN-111 TaxID=3377733 RepID=UPI003C72275F
MIAELLADFFSTFVGSSWGKAAARRAWAREAERGVIVSGLRVVSGSQRGLSREWRIGEWSVAPGRLSLDGIDVHVLSVVADSGRPASCGESLAGEDTRAISLRTATAELEWSHMTYLEATARRRLAVPDARP